MQVRPELGISLGEAGQHPVSAYPRGSLGERDKLSHRPAVNRDLETLTGLDPPEYVGCVVAEIAYRDLVHGGYRSTSATLARGRAIGRHFDLPVISISRGGADARFGALSAFVSLDLASSSALTQKLLGWQPVHPGLIADLEEGHYFETANAMAGRRADRAPRSG